MKLQISNCIMSSSDESDSQVRGFGDVFKCPIFFLIELCVELRFQVSEDSEDGHKTLRPDLYNYLIRYQRRGFRKENQSLLLLLWLM
ncbi:unnamed protein product [Thlaspi arvense]|uniref:Uncharacterized protein n=1 Tax=Thlaspi arvense TaxID=13288 RepID=A0AAU9S6L5_THLAR|nr:unnamed protein product [Thlaspi arvense]